MMGHTNRWHRKLGVLAGMAMVGTLGFGGQELTAQERPPDQDRTSRVVVASAIQGPGWLGIQITGPGTPGGSEGWWIERVVAESPAEEAGLQEGDEILEIDGDPMSAERLDALTAGLRPGDEVVLRIRRDGAASDYRITAARRPFMVLQPGEGARAFSFDGSGLTFDPDSMQARFRVAMDTMQLRLRSLDSLLVRLPEGGDTLHVRFRSPDFERERLEFRMLHPDSLLTDRVREFRMLPDSADFERVWMEYSLAPMFGAGPRAVAGAELTPMNPGLATYFGVEEGLLVVEVVEGGLLEGAGVRAGDVLVEVDGEPVTSVAHFRTHFQRGWRSPPVEIALVRDGDRQTVEVR